MNSKKGVHALAACLGASALIWGASSAAQSTLTGAFDSGPGGAPQQFNPLTASAGYSWFNKYFGTLVLYNAEMNKIGGDLASYWNVSPDGRKITFKLRTGVSWHDGKPFTSKDVKFTLDLLKNPDLPNQFWARLSDIQNVQTPDANTVVLELAKPNIALIDALTNVMLVPEHALSGIAVKDLRTSTWWKTQPIGTGPYKWAKYVPDQYVVLDANPAYYGGKPKIDVLINRYFKDDGAAVLALRSGEIQYTYLSLDQSRTAPQGKYKVIAGPSHVMNYIGVNLREPRFQDVRVRRAIMLAINRSALMSSLYGTQAKLANCVTTDEQYVPADLNAYAYNPVEAKKLLTEAGWSRFADQPIELLTYYSDPVTKSALAVIQSNLADVGIKVQPRFVDPPTYGGLARAGKFNMTFAGTTNGPDPDVLMSVLGSAYSPPRGYNLMHVSMPQLDKLLEDGRTQPDPVKRRELYRDMCRYTNANLPLLPILEANRFAGIVNELQNFVWTPAPGGGRYADHPELWSLR